MSLPFRLKAKEEREAQKKREKKPNGRISFIITQYEQGILLHIQATLGFGTVRFDKGVNAFRFVVEDAPSILLLAHLFNGNLVLRHRIAQMSA